MLGTELQLKGVHSENRFYIPVKARKNQSQRKQAHRVKNDEAENADSSPKSKLLDSENKNSDESLGSLSKQSSCPSVETISNIDRLLESTRPLVHAQYFSKATMRGWKTCDVEYHSYFSLNDLWESFKEWSVYGAGVPLLLDQDDSVVQYYVPSLAAIQLYSQSAQKSNAKPRYTSEDSDGDYYRDSSSDGSSASEYGKGIEHLIVTSNSQYLTGDVSFGMSRLPVHDKHSTIQEGFSSDDSETGNPQDLLFEYFEPDNPYSREPLADKVLYLARTPLSWRQVIEKL